MARVVKTPWLSLALLALRLTTTVHAAACSCTGLDYTDGGSYLVDGASNDDFTFTSVFEACDQPDDVHPILVSPDGKQYSCTTIGMELEGQQQQSACDIPYSQMPSGKWSIVIQADNVNFQVIREFQLTVTTPDHITTTITPTVVVGVTTTAPAVTIAQTITQTSTQIGRAPTVWLPVPVTTIETTLEETRTVGSTTSYYAATTVGVAASCHGATTYRQPVPDKPAPQPATPKPAEAAAEEGAVVVVVVGLAADRGGPEVQEEEVVREVRAALGVVPEAEVARVVRAAQGVLEVVEAVEAVSVADLVVADLGVQEVLVEEAAPGDQAVRVALGEGAPGGRVARVVALEVVAAPAQGDLVARGVEGDLAALGDLEAVVDPAGDHLEAEIGEVVAVAVEAAEAAAVEEAVGGAEVVEAQEAVEAAVAVAEALAADREGVVAAAVVAAEEEVAVVEEDVEATQGQMAEKREVAKAAALTTTVEATVTVTSTTTVVVPGRTWIETVYDFTTATFNPPAQTVCDQQQQATLTVFSMQPTQTVYEVDHVTRDTVATVWVGQTRYTTYTNYQSASICWAAGGRYGV
ncbi:hypothetical protein B0H63DRAFT_551973 [Podospora didyma]|uniref:Uncharacterized protein n=1 Tax=Podospora didyma TaxID=330526 RepID=A0AAE0N4K8_9PEZI|nr:hypothetical protein B0H63DRAFT_551973 [Podospora didyma]